MERKSFVFYRTFYEGVMDLPRPRRLAFFDAICRYGLDGEWPDHLSGAELACFRQIHAVLEDNKERFENAKKGGAPKGNKNASKKKKQPVVDLETTGGYEKNNRHIYDEDVDEDVDGEVVSGKPDHLSPPDEIILYLNEKAGRAYQRTETNRNLVLALLEHYPSWLIMKVIDNKVAMWKDDPKMAVYLRPKTLFDPDNFDNYLNEDEVEP